MLENNRKEKIIMEHFFPTGILGRPVLFPEEGFPAIAYQKGLRMLRSNVTHLLHVHWKKGDEGRARWPQVEQINQSPPLCSSIGLKLPRSTQYGQRIVVLLFCSAPESTTNMLIQGGLRREQAPKYANLLSIKRPRPGGQGLIKANSV